MSFASLLSQITKDKKLEEKTRLSGLANQSKASSSLAKSPASSRASPAAATHRTHQPGKAQPKTYFDDEDPAVRRLKEARRKEREKLQECKAGASNSKSKAKGKTQPASPARARSSKPSSASPLIKRAGQGSSASPPVPVVTKSRFKNKPYLKNSRNTSSVTDSGPAPPKLSFRELMKQAESIDKPIVASTPFKAAKKQNNNEPSRAYQSLQKSRSRENEHFHSAALSSRRNGSRPPASPPPRTSHKLDIPTGPRSRPSQTSSNLPSNSHRRKPALAQPNPDLLNKLKKRQTQLQSKHSGQPYPNNRRKPSGSKSQDAYDIDAGDSEDSDDYGYAYGYNDYEDDGFIVDDEEEEGYEDDAEYHRKVRKEKERRMESQGYNREEIWEIFNRGKKRNYYDRDVYDSDDMEATGTEILEDEERTLKQAKLDDLKEQKLLERKAAEKKKMLHR